MKEFPSFTTKSVSEASNLSSWPRLLASKTRRQASWCLFLVMTTTSMKRMPSSILVEGFTPTRRSTSIKFSKRIKSVQQQQQQQQRQHVHSLAASFGDNTEQDTENDKSIDIHFPHRTGSVTAIAEDSSRKDKTQKMNDLATVDKILDFPSYSQLMTLRYGEFFTSDTIVVKGNNTGKEYKFCVKFYPRGGGHKFQHILGGSSETNQNDRRQQKSGFGMSYKVLPLFGDKRDEKVGIYLQYLPDDPDDAVDASFSFRLLGRQVTTRRFDVEFRSGMRFVDLTHTKLAQGRANDFGAHLMQTMLLSSFLEEGYLKDGEDDADPVQVQVSITLHNEQPPSEFSTNTKGAVSSLLDIAKLDRALEDIRQVDIPDAKISPSSSLKSPETIYQQDPTMVREMVRSGRIVVPILRKLSERNRMFELGVYPGVEYRILRISDPNTDQDLFYHQEGADYELKPIYPLVSQLERPWPVKVNERDIPKLYTVNMYNAVSALGSLFTAVTGLVTAFVISQAISLFFIPSKSMDPTLKVGDVLVVDKVTPRLFLNQQRVGDIVLFHPPEGLQEIVRRSTGGNGISDRDLFVKRVAARPGDKFDVVDKQGTVRVNGESPTVRRDLCDAEPLRLIERYIDPKTQLVKSGEVVVLGDCSSVSIDSRVWGPLPVENIVGQPLFRIWPLARFGSISALPLTEETAAETGVGNSGSLVVDTPTQKTDWSD